MDIFALNLPVLLVMCKRSRKRKQKVCVTITSIWSLDDHISYRNGVRHKHELLSHLVLPKRFQPSLNPYVDFRKDRLPDFHLYKFGRSGSVTRSDNQSAFIFLILLNVPHQTISCASRNIKPALLTIPSTS